MMRKGQVKRLDGSDSIGQAKFVASLFQIAAWRISLSEFSCLKIIIATEPQALTRNH
jgi:hypothetical protein